MPNGGRVGAVQLTEDRRSLRSRPGTEDGWRCAPDGGPRTGAAEAATGKTDHCIRITLNRLLSCSTYQHYNDITIQTHRGFIMKFLLKLLRNLAFLIGIGIVLYILFPEMMSGVFQLYGKIFGPLALLALVVAALPRGRS